MWWERYSYPSYCVSGLRCKRLKKLPRSLDAWSRWLPCSAFPGSAWGASARRGQRGHGGSFIFFFLQPVFLWITGEFLGSLALSLEGGASGCKESGAGWGSQRGEAPSECKRNRPQEPLVPRLCLLPCITWPIVHEQGQRFLPTSCSLPCLLRGANYLAC